MVLGENGAMYVMICRVLIGGGPFYDILEISEDNLRSIFLTLTRPSW